MQQQVHLGQQVRERFGLAAENALPLEDLTILNGPTLLFQMPIGLYEEATSAAGRIQDGFAETRVDDLDHKPDHRTRSIELTRVSGSIAHLLQHRLVEMAEGMDLFARGKMNLIDLVNDVPQEVAIDHPIHGALEDRGDDVMPVTAVGALQAS